MIAFEHVTMRFGRFCAVDDVSLTVAAGQTVALWGANGAGKTTLIRCALGLHRFAGRVTVAGFNVLTHGKQARAQIGYVPQELGFYDELRVDEAVRLFGRLKGLRVGRVGPELEKVGLGGNECKRIRELSGGMKQRLALALALLGDPSVLILDEVTASLDSLGRQEFIASLGRLAHSGRAMLFASHRLDEVQSLADRVVLMEKGRVIGQSTPADMRHQSEDQGILKLRMDRPMAHSAMASLTRRGFEARLNGVGVLVRVGLTNKATPIHALAEDRIVVHDFELVGGNDFPCTEVDHD